MCCCHWFPPDFPGSKPPSSTTVLAAITHNKVMADIRHSLSHNSVLGWIVRQDFGPTPSAVVVVVTHAIVVLLGAGQDIAVHGDVRVGVSNAGAATLDRQRDGLPVRARGIAGHTRVHAAVGPSE